MAFTISLVIFKLLQFGFFDNKKYKSFTYSSYSSAKLFLKSLDFYKILFCSILNKFD